MPENILPHDRSVFVTDFGIAFAISSAGGQRLTGTGMSIGSPQYMAPEQAAAERTIDSRADIFGLGAVTYEMLAGEAPFSGPTVQVVLMRISREQPRPLSALRPSVPASAEAAVFKALGAGAAVGGEGYVEAGRPFAYAETRRLQMKDVRK